MRKHIYKITKEHFGGEYVGCIETEPECGKDFCDSCGDCLHCYGNDPCYGNSDGEHLWVEYVEENDEDHSLHSIIE